VEEPRTHYQLSFTTRQGLFLFIGVLAGLGLAFFFGLMTGLGGREPAPATVAAARTPAPTPGPTPTVEAIEFPKAVRGVAPARGSSRPGTTILPTPPGSSPTSPGPAPSPGIQLFDDAPAVERPTAAPAPPQPARAKPSPAPSTASASSAAFWVQALSASSEKEADARRDRLVAHGFPSAVVPGPGPHGRVYRVRVGPFRTRDEAQRAATRLKTREKLEPWIVPPGK
jgi:cell division septation protein DedD